MRTTLNINDKALADALALAPGKTKTEVINEALRKYVRGKRRKELLKLRGKVKWEGDLDALRRRT
jgi:Arc/MetJ family transcription regulator